MRLEHCLGRAEPLSAEFNLPPVRQGVRLHVESRVVSEHFFLLDVIGHETELLLDLTDSVEISRVVEGITSQQ